MPQQLSIVHLISHDIKDLSDHVITLASELSRRQTEPYVVGPLGIRMRRQLSRRGLRWVNLPIPDSLDSSAHKKASANIARLLDNLQPSLLHAHGFQASYCACLTVERLHQPLPFIASPHGILTAPTKGILRRFHHRRVSRRVLRCPDVVTTSSESHKQAMAALDGRRPDHDQRDIRVIPVGVSRAGSSLFDAGQKRHVVGLRRDASILATTAPLEKHVPWDDLLGAVARINRDMPSLDLLIIGEGPYKEDIQQRAHELGLSGSTVLLPNRHDTLDILAACNLFVALTDDALGINRALSALARRLRLVAADLPGLRDIFGDMDEISLIDMSDRATLADAIRSELETIPYSKQPEAYAEDGSPMQAGDMLVSEALYDLDAHGLQLREETGESSQLDRILQHHSIPNMLKHLLDAYNSVL